MSTYLYLTSQYEKYQCIEGFGGHLKQGSWFVPLPLAYETRKKSCNYSFFKNLWKQPFLWYNSPYHMQTLTRNACKAVSRVVITVDFMDYNQLYVDLFTVNMSCDCL